VKYVKVLKVVSSTSLLVLRKRQQMRLC